MHWSEIAFLTLGILFAIPVVVFIGIILTLAWGMVVSWRSGPDPIAGQLEEADRAIQALPLEQAQAEAELILSANEAFRVSTPSGGGSPLLPELGPTLHDFFRRFPEVQTPRGGLSSEEITRSDWANGYVHLGQIDEHAHLMARPGEDTVHEIADDIPFEGGPLVSYPSIFHWIVAEARREELFAHPH